MTCFSWEASGERAVQLRLYKSHSKMINVGTVLFFSSFRSILDKLPSRVWLLPSSRCRHWRQCWDQNLRPVFFFFFAYMLADADTSCGVFVCRPCEWMEPHRREVFMHHHSLSSAVGCWEAVSRSFPCLSINSHKGFDRWVHSPLFLVFCFFFNVGLLILSVSVF